MTIDPPGAPAEIPPYPSEALLLEVLREVSGERVLAMSPGVAQFAGAAAGALSSAAVTCTYFDLYRAQLARQVWQEGPSNLEIECAADLPVAAADAVALPFSSSGEAELARELIQQSHQRLRVGGRVFAATDNPRDTWLGEQLRRVFSKVDRRPRPGGVVYVGVAKAAPAGKIKDFSCEFAFRDRGRLIRAVSRPGVFSHRHIDPGARRLLAAMEVLPGMRVLDIGCGSGVVGLAAAGRGEDVRVHAIDSNARAVECTARGAQQNGYTGVTVELTAGIPNFPDGLFDLALANPPYYGGFRIARHFLAVGQAALRSGGRMLVVTKQSSWYAEHLPAWFDEVTSWEDRGYFVFAGRKA